MREHSTPTLGTVAAVSVAALFAGACAGRAVISVPPVVLPAPAPAAILPAVPDIAELPVGDYSFNELVVIDGVVVEAPEPESETCDVVAAMHASADNTTLRDAPLWVGTATHRYTEVRVGVLKPYRDQEYDIALNVLDLESCETEIVTIRKTYGTRQLSVPVTTKKGTVWQEQRQPAALVRAPDGWDIEVVRRANGIEWNNWATDFHVNSETPKVVVGLKFPLLNENRKRGEPRFNEVFYTPVGRDVLADPAIRRALVEAGLSYATELADRAFEELKSDRVMSHAMENTLVSDVPQLAAKDFVYRMAVEHMDQTEFTLDPLWTTDRIFAVIGANRERFATLTCSPAAACGPMQFTKGTYHFMDQMYPAAGLINDFLAGVREPLNVMKAAILLDDHNLNALASVFGLSPLREERLSSYNTGSARTIAVRRIADATNASEWTDARGKRCSRANKYAECLLDETKGYVVKYRYLERDWHVERALALIP